MLKNPCPAPADQTPQSPYSDSSPMKGSLITLLPYSRKGARHFPSPIWGRWIPEELESSEGRRMRPYPRLSLCLLSFVLDVLSLSRESTKERPGWQNSAHGLPPRTPAPTWLSAAIPVLPSYASRGRAAACTFLCLSVRRSPPVSRRGRDYGILCRLGGSEGLFSDIHALRFGAAFILFCGKCGE